MGRLKVLCVGYREWSLEIFKKLIENTSFIVTVITSKESLTCEIVKKIEPDIILFYGWSWKVSDEIIDNYFCLCLHPSKLPKYRGGSPIQNQIINGEKDGAISIFRMTKGIDEGDICFQKDMSLEGNIKQIYNRIYEIGLESTLKIIDNFVQKKLKFTPQNNEMATSYLRISPGQSRITIEELKRCSAQDLFNKIRMLTDPYPNAYIVCGDGKKLFLTESHIEE